MHVQSGAPQQHEYLEIAQLYYLLRLRSLSNPPFLNRTLRSCRYGLRRRKQRRLALSDLLPIRLCQLTTGAVRVRKRLAILVKSMESEHDRFCRLACFLVKNERLIDANEFVITDSKASGTLMFMSFDYDFLSCRYDEREWIVIGYVYTEGKTEPHAAFELDLAHLFKNFMRRLSDIVIDVALEHPIHENEVGRMQLQLCWWFTPNPSPCLSSTVPSKQNSVGNEITFKYSWNDGNERHCETIPWTATSRCPFCFFICPDIKSLLLHLCLSHDRLDVRYYSNTVFLEPNLRCPEIEPIESMVVCGGRDVCRSLTERILEDQLLICRQSSTIAPERKRRKTAAKSAPPSHQNAVASKPSLKRNHARLNGRTGTGGKPSNMSRTLFHHGAHFVPVRIRGLPEGYKDSDIEIDDSWILSQQNQTIAMFEDVENDEKELMILWNEMRKNEPEIISDKGVAPFCEKFAKLIRRHERKLRKALLNHLMVLWEFGLLSSSQLERTVNIYDGRD